MPDWGAVLQEITKDGSQSPSDRVRRRYLDKLADHTGRNVITYYSGWLYRAPSTPLLAIGDDDKNAFMTAIHGLDRSKGLDLVLHTPGGNLAAAESLVDYLRAMFGTDIRAVIPQIAMSAGTMIACACRSIVMGKESNLGPIDPQLGGVPCRGVLDEFEQAVAEIKTDPARIALWQAIIGKYHPTFIGECKRACDWAESIVAQWLATGMFAGVRGAKSKGAQVAKKMADHGATRSHQRHLSLTECEAAGLKIEHLEGDPTLQDLVLTVHHAYMHTFTQTRATKIVENQQGAAFMIVAGP